MLKNRVLTASLLAPFIIAAILFLPKDGIAILWGLVILGCGWEWSDLAGLRGGAARIAFVALLLCAMLAIRFMVTAGALPTGFFIPVLIWWAAWGLAFRKLPEKLVSYRYPVALKVVAGAFVLISGWTLLVWLRLNFSEYQLLYFVLLIWLADIAAYFTGKRWGFTKLSAPISPGKSVEGVYGGLFAAIVMALVGGWIFDFSALNLIDFVFLSLFTVAFSIIGDLFESLAKRSRGVKDSGQLLPGHGGLLDRVDSLLAAIAIFYAGSIMIPVFIDFSTSLEPEFILIPDEAPAALEAPLEPVPGNLDEMTPPALEPPHESEVEGDPEASEPGTQP